MALERHHVVDIITFFRWSHLSNGFQEPRWSSFAIMPEGNAEVVEHV